MVLLVLRRLALLVTLFMAVDALRGLFSPAAACIPWLGWGGLAALTSIQLAGVVAWWKQQEVGGETPELPPRLLAWALAFGLLGAAEVVGLHAFGLTDHRQPADVILVLGARVYADGSPSEALSDRVLTAVELHRQGLAPVLFMSGGVGADGQSEPLAMKHLAMSRGVPEEDIVEDAAGSNTQASVANVEVWLAARGQRRLLAVSHYHHLARIEMMARRRGLWCSTVPADEGETRLAMTPYYVVREAALLVFYYVRG
jgi:vancomycin permeability regulator SanA